MTPLPRSLAATALSLATTLATTLTISVAPHRALAADDGAQLVAEYGLRESAQPVSSRPGWRRPVRVVVEATVPGLDAQLREVAPGVEIVPVRTAAEMVAAVPGADAVLGRAGFVCSDAVLAAGRDLRWLQAFTAGVDLCTGRPALLERGLLLTNMRAISAPMIGEHAIAMLLALTRGLHVSIPRQAAGDWNRDYGSTRLVSLQGKTLLVVGLGGIGGEVARRAKALGMRVTATRGTRQERPAWVDEVGLPEDLPRLIAAADAVVHAAPLTPATRGLYDARMFARMKPTAYFVNVARGAAVVTDDLLAALESGRIAGAALDVTEPEPLPKDHPLWRAPNLVLTPHNSGDSDLGADGQLRVLRENLRRYVAGERMLSEVDLRRGY